MLRNLALEFVRVTEAAAIAAAAWIGRGDRHAADQAAVDAMRSRFNNIDFRGQIVIGEGKKDKAPELYVGEMVGRGREPVYDLAVDPLEATDSVALGRYNAFSLIVVGPKGTLLSAPDTYMEKIAVGKEAAYVIDLEATAADNIKKTAKALGKDVREITVVVLERDRHIELIKQIQQAGARVRLITDGDVEPAIAACLPERGVDMLLGIGGSTEAVLAAAAVKMLGGQLLARFKPKDEKHEQDIKAAGITDLNQIFRAEDLARGDDLSFTATGVIEGSLLQGVVFEPSRILTHSLVIRSSGTIRYIKTYHHKSPPFPQKVGDK